MGYQYNKSLQKKSENPDRFIIPEKAMIYYQLGNRGSGKSTVDEVIAEENFLGGHTVIDLHSAPNYESLYWAVNHNCKKYWERWKQEQLRLQKEKRQPEYPHCNCDSRYEILLVIPDYVEIDQDAIDWFNEKWYTKEQWKKLGHLDYGSWKILPDGTKKYERPLNPEYREWIKTRYLPVPNRGFKNRETFVKTLTEILLQARDERRIIVFNPIFYKDVQHKLSTMQMVLNEIVGIVQSHFKPATPISVAKKRGEDKPIPEEEWEPIERNQHRVTILVRELGSLVASSLNEERNQVIVKKAFFKLVKICRHAHITLVGDLQRASDLLASVREQRDFIIFKTSNQDIVSEDYNWIRNGIKEKRKEIALKLGEPYANARYPNIEDLEPDQMYVVYPKKTDTGKRYELFKVRMPHFHHHQEDDDFEDFGIVKETELKKGTWRFITRQANGELVETEKEKQMEDKAIKQAEEDRLFEVAIKLMKPTEPDAKKMSARECFDHLLTMKLIPTDKWKTWTSFAKFMQRKQKKLPQTPT